MTDLKLCPFCGPHDYFKPKMVANGNGHHDIVCPQCGVRKWCEVWDRRPTEDALRAEIANLKLECESWREGAERDRAEIAELSNGVMVASERAGRYAEEIAALRDKYERQPEEVTP